MKNKTAIAIGVIFVLVILYVMLVPDTGMSTAEARCIEKIAGERCEDIDYFNSSGYRCRDSDVFVKSEQCREAE